MDKSKILQGTIGPEDYEEPRCVLCMDKTESGKAVHAIDMMRVVEKLDEYMSRKDYSGAERHLAYWLGEAEFNHDERGRFSVLNEQMGFFRKLPDGEKAIRAAEAALSMIPALGYENAISGATCYINAGTVYEAFDRPELALPLFEDAKRIYETNLREDDSRLGGLYNNMALCYIAMKRYGEAHRLYKMALDVMSRVEGGALERAITLLNMANAVEAEHGLEKGEAKIFQLLDEAEELLDGEYKKKPETRSKERPAGGSVQGTGTFDPGYYAYVCEKCAPTFDYYGYFLTAKKLTERAERIVSALR